MSLSFEPLKTGVPGVFGVRLCGSVGRTEKARLREFADKCLKNAKLRIVLDLGGLDALGGGGASFLAGFQRDLAARGGDLAFVGVGDVVRRYLTLQFKQQTLRVHEDLAAAVAALGETAAPSGPAAAASLSGAQAGRQTRGASRSESGGNQAGGRAAVADSRLDELLQNYGGASVAPSSAADKRDRNSSAAQARAEATDEPEPPSRSTKPEPAQPVGRAAIPSDGPATTGTIGAARPQFITIETALAELKSAVEPQQLERPLRDLLHSFDLATSLVFCARRGEEFATADGSVVVRADGSLAGALNAAGRPLSLLELGDVELSDLETHLLSELRADIVLPVAPGGALVAIAFIRRGGEVHEYGVSETFALSLLTRSLADETPADAQASPRPPRDAPDVSAGGPGPADNPPAELQRKVAQMQALFSISEDLARVHEPGRLTEMLCATVLAQLGVRSVAVLELENETLLPRAGRGVELDQVPSLKPFGPQLQGWLVEQPLPAQIDQLPSMFNRFRDPLSAAGFTVVAALRSRGQLLGALLLGDAVRGHGSDLDLDFLSTLLNQAAIAMDGARMLQQAHEQGMGIIRTLVSLVEQRQQAGTRMTDRVAQLVSETARELGYPSEKMRDLVYGTVLRDIGMIPISDLVLRSPRKLNDMEWKQIKAHPETGAELLGPLQLPPTVRDVVLHHHERFNGEGYPRGVQGRAIPLSARIVSVVESYVAMVSDLPYRTALSEAEAVSILSENWGMRYDPDVVEAFLRVLARSGRDKAGVPEPVGVADAGDVRS